MWLYIEIRSLKRQVKMRAIMVGPNPIWMVSQEEEEIRTHERCQKHRENAMWAQKEKVQIQGEGSQGKPTLLTPCSCTFSFQNCEKINFCCLIHPVCGILSWKPYQPKTDAQYGKVEKGPTILIHQDKNYVPVLGGGLLPFPFCP